MTRKQSDLIKSMGEKDILYSLYMTQFVLLIIAFALGYFLFEEVDEFLGLWKASDPNILIVGGGVALLVIIIDFLLTRWLPKELLDDGGINERIFQKQNTIHIFFLCILISASEEILFRGVIQTHFGIIIASTIFALLHIRYLNKWVLLIVVVSLSFVLGFVYEATENLWVTIFSHFLIDFVAALKIRNDYLKKVLS